MEENFNEKHFKRIWTEMRQRCNNPNHQQFKFYGAIGVKVCDEWNTYSKFKEDMKDSYINFITINGEKNISLAFSDNLYSKETCHWETYSINNTLNKDIARYKYNGQLYNISELHEKFSKNMSWNGIYGRIHSRGYKDGDEIDEEILYQTICPISLITSKEEYDKVIMLNNYDKNVALEQLLFMRDNL